MINARAPVSLTKLLEYARGIKVDSTQPARMRTGRGTLELTAVPFPYIHLYLSRDLSSPFYAHLQRMLYPFSFFLKRRHAESCVSASQRCVLRANRTLTWKPRISFASVYVGTVRGPAGDTGIAGPKLSAGLPIYITMVTLFRRVWPLCVRPR